MKSKMSSIVMSIIIIVNLSIPVPQNVGQSGLSSSGTEILILSNIYALNPQIVGHPSSESNETAGLVLLNISSPIPQNVGKPNSDSSGTDGLANSPWPMFRHNLNHTGLSPYNTNTNFGQLKWSFTTGWYVTSSPAIGPDGAIYVGSEDFKLYAINSDGSERWNYVVAGGVPSSPAIGYDGTIYVGSYDFKLYAINPNGTEKWSFTTGSKVYSSPAIGFDGTIYVGSYDGKLYAINPDGTEKWSCTTGDNIISSPAIGSDGTIFIGSNDDKLYAINPNGSEKWSYTTGSAVQSSPVIGLDGTIYVGSGDSKVYAINPNGTEEWNFTTGGTVASSPAISPDGTIYVGSNDYNLYGINPNGTEKWSFMTGSYVGSSPAIGTNGTIFVGSHDCNLYSINPDGTEKWSFTTDNLVFSSPAIGSDGTIYVGSWDHKLYAIGTPETPPIANIGPDQTVNEGNVVEFNGSASYDPDGTIETYEWDFDSSDGLWWETGAVPDATDPMTNNVYGDDGKFIVTLRVIDNDNLSAINIRNVIVQNVNPTGTIESMVMNVEIGLRVAGRKYNNVSMTLYEEGNSVGYVSIERMPGSPNEQMAWIPITLDMTKTYNSTVTYTPEDPPNIGANPVWIYIKSKNGSIKKIHHTFNVQQSKKRDSNHWNHVEPWEVDLNDYFIGLPFEIISHIIDPGSDDETLTYSYGCQTVIVTYLNNPPNLDPYPSPEINPRDIMDTTTLVYEGPGAITLVIKDDDNTRSGIGQGNDSIDVV